MKRRRFLASLAVVVLFPRRAFGAAQSVSVYTGWYGPIKKRGKH